MCDKRKKRRCERNGYSIKYNLKKTKKTNKQNARTQTTNTTSRNLEGEGELCPNRWIVGEYEMSRKNTQKFGAWREPNTNTRTTIPRWFLVFLSIGWACLVCNRSRRFRTISLARRLFRSLSIDMHVFSVDVRWESECGRAWCFTYVHILIGLWSVSV